MENWLPILELDSRYEISDLGNMRSVDTFDSWGRIHRGEIVRIGHDKRGYHRVRACVKNRRRSVRIHRMVAKAFIPNPDNLPQVNHIDGDKDNNAHTNLEWTTNRGNAIHARKLGLMKSEFGEKSVNFKSSINVYDSAGVIVDVLTGNADMKAKGYDWRNVNACIYGTERLTEA